MWSGLNAICKRRLIERYLLYNYLICSLPWSNALHISSTSMQAQTHVTIRTHSPHTKVCGLLHLWTTSRCQCTAPWARIQMIQRTPVAAGVVLGRGSMHEQGDPRKWANNYPTGHAWVAKDPPSGELSYTCSILLLNCMSCIVKNHQSLLAKSLLEMFGLFG